MAAHEAGIQVFATGGIGGVHRGAENCKLLFLFHALIQMGYTPENHKAIGFISNTGPDSLKNYKATKSSLNVGP